MGPGRAFGVDSGYLGKKFSKIFSCGIWEALERDSVNPTIAFVTDVGNDLAYEAPPDAILERLKTCLERLQTHHAQVVITALPIDPLKRLKRIRFQVLRSLLYPQSRMRFVDFLDRAQELNEGLVSIAGDQKMTIFTVPNEWYGLDPIHPRGRFLKQLWLELFALSNLTPSNQSRADSSLALSCFLRCLTAPNTRRVGLNRCNFIRRVQLFDGTQISLY